MVKNIPGQVLDDNQVIWRYMDFASFYSLLLTQGLFFKRLDKYTDENEGTLWEETRHEQRAYLTKIDPFPSKHTFLPSFNLDKVITSGIKDK